MKPHIYKVTNLIDGKIYIGQHIGTVKNYFAGGTYINRAIKKHGKDNFKREIIIEGDFTREELDELEIKYIYEFCSYFHDHPNKGYNLTTGGAGQRELKHTEKTIKLLRETSKSRKSVIQLDMDGNYIGRFSSIRYASKKLKIEITCILRCCKERGLKRNKSAGGFRWVYETDYNNGNYEIRPIFETTREVNQFSLSGEFIKKHKSAGKAAEQVGVSRNAILNVLYGKRNTSAGFKWSF